MIHTRNTQQQLVVCTPRPTCDPLYQTHPTTTNTQHLDEIQSYVLLRRWWSTHPDRQDPSTAPPATLSAAQLQDLAVLLCRERTFLLNALESLLRLAHGEHNTDDPQHHLVYKHHPQCYHVHAAQHHTKT